MSTGTGTCTRITNASSASAGASAGASACGKEPPRQRPNQASYIGELTESAAAGSYLPRPEFNQLSTPSPCFSIPSPPSPETRKQTSACHSCPASPARAAEAANDRRLRSRTESQAANTARSLNACRGHGAEQYETPCGRRIRGTKDDRVWAAARTGSVLVTTSVAQSPNGAEERSLRCLGGLWRFGRPWIQSCISDMCPPTHAHSLRPALCRSGHVSWIGLDD